MVSGLIGLLVLIIIVGIVAWLITHLIDMLPMDARLKQAARVIVIVIAILIILVRALPLIGVSV